MIREVTHNTLNNVLSIQSPHCIRMLIISYECTLELFVLYDKCRELFFLCWIISKVCFIEKSPKGRCPCAHCIQKGFIGTKVTSQAKNHNLLTMDTNKCHELANDLLVFEIFSGIPFIGRQQLFSVNGISQL